MNPEETAAFETSSRAWITIIQQLFLKHNFFEIHNQLKLWKSQLQQFGFSEKATLICSVEKSSEGTQNPILHVVNDSQSAPLIDPYFLSADLEGLSFERPPIFSESHSMNDFNDFQERIIQTGYCTDISHFCDQFWAAEFDLIPIKTKLGIKIIINLKEKYPIREAHCLQAIAFALMGDHVMRAYVEDFLYDHAADVCAHQVSGADFCQTFREVITRLISETHNAFNRTIVSWGTATYTGTLAASPA